MSHDVTLWFGPDHGMSEKEYEELVLKFARKIKKVYQTKELPEIFDPVWEDRICARGVYYTRANHEIYHWHTYSSAEAIARQYPDEIFWSINDVEKDLDIEEDLLTFYQVRKLP